MRLSPPVLPVESDAEHPVVPEGGDEEVDVLAGGAKVGEGAVVQRDLGCDSIHFRKSHEKSS